MKKEKIRDICMTVAGICFFLAGLNKSFVENKYNVLMIILGIFLILFFSTSLYRGKNNLSLS